MQRQGQKLPVGIQPTGWWLWLVLLLDCMWALRGQEARGTPRLVAFGGKVPSFLCGWPWKGPVCSPGRVAEFRGPVGQRL